MVMLDQDNPKEDYGHVYIDFLAPGSVYFNIDIYGVDPLQLLTLGQYLELVGRKKQLERIESQSVQVARPNILVGEK